MKRFFVCERKVRTLITFDTDVRSMGFRKRGHRIDLFASILLSTKCLVGNLSKSLRLVLLRLP